MNKPEHDNTRTPFLKQIAQHYSASFDNVDDFCFVFPNRRSGQFFLKYFEECSSKNCMHPNVTTISDFVDDNSDYTLATPTELIFNLYLAYCEVTKNKDYEFDKFIHWGNILVTDFNDVDQYMVDAKQLFSNISDWKEISTDYLPDELKAELRRYLNMKLEDSDGETFWKNLNPQQEKQVTEKFTSLWKILYPLYQKYNELLEQKNLTYTGKMLREFVLKLKDHAIEDFPFEKYVFVGFNLLSTSEMMIFDSFKKKGIAEFHWDDASPALKNSANKGHRHLALLSNRYKSSFKLENISDFPKNINVVGIPSHIGQTKYAFTLVEKLIQDGEVKDRNNGIDTAIVLPDEGLFTNLTNSVPANIKNINATLGLSLRNSDISSLIRNISKVHKNAYRPGGEEHFKFLKEFVKEILSHPIIKSLYPKDVTEINNHINLSNDFYVGEEYLRQTKLGTIFTTISDTKDKNEVIQFINRLISLCNDINSHYANHVEEDGTTQLSLQSTFALQYIDILNETKTLIQGYGIPMCESSVFYLFDKLASLYTVPFEGEPLSGLQIMGMLETRNLDFDNLIILSMNERVFPRKFFKSSFIPPNMRRYYLMSTIDEQESMSAYYFYRLITRAKNLFLIYDTSSTGIGSSEYSRFISQLEKVYGCRMHFHNINLQVRPESPLTISVEKTDEILKKIKRYTIDDASRKKLSASSIKTLIKCPLKFYLNHIEGLDDENEESQFMDYATFGTIVHDTLQAFYYPEEGKKNIVTKKQIKDFKDKKLERELIRQVNKTYLHKENLDEELIGETAITMKALHYYAEQVLEYDMGLLENDDDFLAIYECEIPHEVSLTIGDNTFNFTYKVDRIDRINDKGELRIIDYKTGKDNVKFKNIGDVVSNKDSGHYLAIMQLFLYCYALKNDANITNFDVSVGLQPIIYKIKDMGTSGITHDKNMITNLFSDENSGIYNEFLSEMAGVINDFFDKKVPFTQCENDKKAECKYCRFIEFCRR